MSAGHAIPSTDDPLGDHEDFGSWVRDMVAQLLADHTCQSLEWDTGIWLEPADLVRCRTQFDARTPFWMFKGPAWMDCEPDLAEARIQAVREGLCMLTYHTGTRVMDRRLLRAVEDGRPLMDPQVQRLEREDLLRTGSRPPISFKLFGQFMDCGSMHAGGGIALMLKEHHMVADYAAFIIDLADWRQGGQRSLDMLGRWAMQLQEEGL